MPQNFSDSRAGAYRRAYVRARRRGSITGAKVRRYYSRSNTLYRPRGFNQPLAVKRYRGGASAIPRRLNYTGPGDEIRRYPVEIAEQDVREAGVGGVWGTLNMIQRASLATSGVSGDLFAPGRGTGVYERIGQRVLVKQWKVKLQLRNNAQTSAAYNQHVNPSVRIIMIAVRTDGSILTPDGLFEEVAAGGITQQMGWQRNWATDTMTSYSVLHDKVYTVDDDSFSDIQTGGTTSGYVTRGRFRQLEIKVRPNIPVQYAPNALVGDFSTCDTTFHILASRSFSGASGNITVEGLSRFLFTP